MKKIMFNDKYGLTQAVLEGRKTQTRRIADTAGRLRDITVRQALEEVNKGRACLFDEGRPLALSAYKLGETIAIAQKYADLAYDGEFFSSFREGHIRERMPQQDVCEGRLYAAPHPHY